MYRYEFPEIEDWDERSYRNNYNDRCLPAIAALTAVAAFAACRPRSCYPRYGYSYGYYPYYRPVYCSPYFICIPRPCYPR
ncbi:hypothetical protein [Dendrosporobacter sp. 1207_IL3150]|uniref:hypothetical protein n=1 Tax=Dendrosporobacter sp. 1207_IL3150 TaxID=3084054 RepID=UPI002FDAB8F3